MVILKLQGVTDVNSALAMRNAVLYIDRKDVQLPEGSFFLADLMGMEVRTPPAARCWDRSRTSSPCPPTMCM